METFSRSRGADQSFDLWRWWWTQILQRWNKQHIPNRQKEGGEKKSPHFWEKDDYYWQQNYCFITFASYFKSIPVNKWTKEEKKSLMSPICNHRLLTICPWIYFHVCSDCVKTVSIILNIKELKLYIFKSVVHLNLSTHGGISHLNLHTLFALSYFGNSCKFLWVCFCATVIVHDPTHLRETYCITGLFIRAHIFAALSYNRSAVTLKCF